MKIQRILYNQLNSDYLYSDAERFCYLHTDGDINTHTSAGKLSFNIYSKLVGYAASKNFMGELEAQSERMHCQDWKQGLLDLAQKYDASHIIVMDSAENYISQILRKLQKELSEHEIILDIRPNQQFLINHQTFQEKYEKPPVMETFYRWMRKETRILMDGDQPVGGQRNYDKENRKFDKNFVDAEHLIFENTDERDKAITHYQADIAKRGKDIVKYLPTSTEQAQALLQHFIDHHLERFGELEDAMYTTSDFVHHSLLSIPINFGLLTPQEVLQAVEQADAPINSKEGFIRQVLGWREYMYHWYHHYKNEIYEQNALNHTTPVPDRFWWPDESSLEMHCVQYTLEKVDRLAYSHHIERLMVIGNFCLLTGLDPHQVNKWFWEQYADAFERVVTPNVLGMSQYADGGNLATKPYVASANYINKMSNHCSQCRYDPKEKYGENACPLNYLYRNFVDKNQELFKQGRQGFLLKHLEKIDRERISKQAQEFLDKVFGN